MSAEESKVSEETSIPKPPTANVFSMFGAKKEKKEEPKEEEPKESESKSDSKSKEGEEDKAEEEEVDVVDAPSSLELLCIVILVWMNYLIRLKQNKSKKKGGER